MQDLYLCLPPSLFESETLFYIFIIKNENIPTARHSHLLTTRNLPITKALASAEQHSTTVHISACPERKPSPEHCVTYTVRLL